MTETNGSKYVAHASRNLSFPDKLPLKWGRFSPDRSFALDTDQGAMLFPMNYHRGNIRLFAWMLGALLLNAFISVFLVVIFRICFPKFRMRQESPARIRALTDEAYSDH